MRENRPYGSEGGEVQSPSLPLSSLTRLSVDEVPKRSCSLCLRHCEVNGRDAAKSAGVRRQNRGFLRYPRNHGTRRVT